MKTKYNTDQLAFYGSGRHSVIGRFNGSKLSSDGGGLLLCEVEQRSHIHTCFAGYFTDHRDAERIAKK